MVSGWQSEADALGSRPRPRSHSPVELTVRDAVPDAMQWVRHIHRLRSGERFVPRPAA